MLPLLALAVVAGLVAALLHLRARRRAPGWARRWEHGGGRVTTVLAVVAVVGAFIEPARAVVGLGLPEQCTGKHDSQPALAPDDTEALKAEVAQQDSEADLPSPGLVAEDVGLVAQLTGPGSLNRTQERWGVWGTDLGHMFRHRGRLGLVFGDTFGSPDRSGWRSNVLAWAEPDGIGPGGIRFSSMHTGAGPEAVELLGSIKQRGWEQTVIPTNSVSLGDRIVVHYMSVKCWGPHGKWAVNHAGLATSDDDGRTWTKHLGSRWPAGTGFAQVAFAEDGGWLYAFGIPEGRDGAARLGRVRPRRVLDLDAWRYFDGERWVPDERQAMLLTPPSVSELTVARHEPSGRWVMLYLDERRNGIVMRTAEELTGPWSSAQLVVSAVDQPQLYAPFVVPGLGGPDEIYFTMSRFDYYNVFLMRARLSPSDITATASSD